MGVLLSQWSLSYGVLMACVVSLMNHFCHLLRDIQNIGQNELSILEALLANMGMHN